tara:strand:- start:8358 stop:9431 length:1074 start_codon:yes stop_codon:yes gene_type:complete
MIVKSFSYHALLNSEKSPGVNKKILGTVSAVCKLNIESEAYIVSPGIKGLFIFVRSLVVTKADVVMIRYSDLAFPFVFLAMLYGRCFGKQYIVDVPTPRVVGLKEYTSEIRNPIKRVCRKVLSVVLGSWVLFPSNLVIQYAEEGWWYRLGLDNKILKIGNGLNVDTEIPLVQYCWPSEELRLIAVAQLAKWHGYDRIIRAIAHFNSQSHFSVSLTIVGEGSEKIFLEQLVSDLNLWERVVFTGVLVGSDLDQVFLGKHAGVSSLGLYRKGLNEASDLKTREYMARGLCVIGAGFDPDFTKDNLFRHVVSNDAGIETIVELFHAFFKCDLPNPQEVRNFAERKLTLQSKLATMFDLLG